MDNLLTVLLTAIAIATLLNVLLKRINIPTIIGYIFTGSIVGILFGINVHGNEELEHIAEFGIVFLMFTIGLELSVNEAKAMRKELFVFGLLQVVLTGGVISLAAQYFFGIETKVAIILGLGLALSSAPIVLKILNESGEINSRFGRSAQGILIFQEISLIIILLMITIFTNTDKSLGALLTETAINAVITLAILIIVGKYVLHYFFKVVSETNTKEIYFGSVLLVVVGSSYLAHYFGFSYTLGAFVAGMMIADTMYKYQIEADLIPFRDLLLGVFFVTVGMQIDFQIIVDNIGIITALIIVLMSIKMLLVFGVLSFFMPKKEAFKVGISIAHIGGPALVVLSLLLSNSMLDTTYIQILIVVIVITMILTPFLLVNLDTIVNVFFKKLTINKDVSHIKNAEEHIILCGYGAFGQSISEKLTHEKIYHQIISNNTDNYVKARKDKKNIFFGEASDRILLENLQVRKSLGVIIAIDKIEEIEKICASLNLIDPKISITAKVQHRTDLKKLDEFNLKSVLDSNEQISSALVEDIKKSILLAEESMNLQYLNNYDVKTPDQALVLLASEQARLLDIISDSFIALRKGSDLMLIKVYHDSFSVLSEIIHQVMNDLTSHASLSSPQYNQMNILLSNQDKYEQANESIKELGKGLFKLKEVNDANTFSNSVVEGLDTILFSLKDVATNYDEDDMMLLEVMTSRNSGGIEKVRSSHLNNENDLNQTNKMLLLSATNLTERLILLFGDIGQNYKKLFSK